MNDWAAEWLSNHLMPADTIHVGTSASGDLIVRLVSAIRARGATNSLLFFEHLAGDVADLLARSSHDPPARACACASGVTTTDTPKSCRRSPPNRWRRLYVGDGRSPDAD